MVRGLTEQRNDGRLTVLRQGHFSSPIQRVCTRPMIAVVGSTPKYRPSSESADCQFMRETSPLAIRRQPRHTGSGRPRLSRSRASPVAMLSTVMVSRFLQTVCSGSARTRFIQDSVSLDANRLLSEPSEPSHIQTVALASQADEPLHSVSARVNDRLAANVTSPPSSVARDASAPEEILTRLMEVCPFSSSSSGHLERSCSPTKKRSGCLAIPRMN
jgi:hypothetical protein